MLVGGGTGDLCACASSIYFQRTYAYMSIYACAMRLQIASSVVRLNHTEHPTQTLAELARVNYPTRAHAISNILPPRKGQVLFPESVRVRI